MAQSRSQQGTGQNPFATQMTPWQKFGLGAIGGGALGQGLYSLFADQTNPADEANRYLSQIPETMKPYYEPYMKAGQQAIPALQNQYGMLMQDPSILYNALASHYSQSPGYNFQLQQSQNAINNAQAAGGMLGTPQHQQLAGQMAQNLASHDFENYLNHVLGLYGSGLSGMGQLGQMGYGASNELAQSLANNLASQAQYAYGGAAGQNAAESGAFGNIFGGLGAIASIL